MMMMLPTSYGMPAKRWARFSLIYEQDLFAGDFAFAGFLCY
jgi:hypothetical protein